MKKSWMLVIITGLAFGGCNFAPKESPSAQHFAKGFKAYQNGDFETAALYLKPLAENDNPAAQLLLARMYANGQGVTESIEKSEALRNKAALRMYSQINLKPGQLDPSSESLAVLEKRVNYYVNGLENGDAPPQETATPAPAAVSEAAPANAPAPETTSAPPTPIEKFQDLPQQVAEVSNDHNQEEILSVSRISLSNLLVEASSGKKETAHQIAEAYKKGLYGIKPDAEQAAVWGKK